MKEFVIRMFGESITERMNELGMWLLGGSYE